MTDFAVLVEGITIYEHPNADALEIAQIRGYQAIVRKGAFKTGDLVAYIPEASLVPQSLLEEMGLVGMLAGRRKDRVKAVRLRGVISQGLCYPARPTWVKGQDVTDILGIKKYEVTIPACLQGQVWNAGKRRTLRYDISNWKNYPSILEPGEEVVFTEKIHGTFMGVGLVPVSLADPFEGQISVFSKGLGSNGAAMKRSVPENHNNLYVRTYNAYHEQFERAFRLMEANLPRRIYTLDPIFILGEVFGKGMQDLTYGYDSPIGYRIFDIYVGERGHGGWYLNDRCLDEACAFLGLERVPVLYRGPFSTEVMQEHTVGKETISGKAQHLREGIVMKPVIERHQYPCGRVILKSVSTDYLMRKNATEFN